MTREERIAYIRERRSRGDTLEAIGQSLGITRERTRQIASQFGIEAGSRHTPEEVLAICRKAPNRSAARRIIGQNIHWLDAEAVLEETGHWRALVRLWDWRARNAQRKAAGAYSRDELINLLQQEAQRIGSTPSQHDMNAPESLTACHTVYVRVFGSMREAQIAAGLTPNNVGHLGHRSHRNR